MPRHVLVQLLATPVEAIATALAAARGWHDLVTPGVLVGVLGYRDLPLVGLTKFCNLYAGSCMVSF